MSGDNIFRYKQPGQAGPEGGTAQALIIFTYLLGFHKKGGQGSKKMKNSELYIYTAFWLREAMWWDGCRGYVRVSQNWPK